MVKVKTLTKALLPLMMKTDKHSLYLKINSLEKLQAFTEEHIFAVWDFMCLLKGVQQKIIPNQVPWFPQDVTSVSVINSIALEEECDMDEHGCEASHFGIYLTAMEQIGAKHNNIGHLLSSLSRGLTIEESLRSLSIQEQTKSYVLKTFSFFDKKPHEIAAAFVFGREWITSNMYSPLLSQVKKIESESKSVAFSTMIHYIERHLELDDAEHFPKALIMLSNLLGHSEEKYKEAQIAASSYLESNLEFLTGIESKLDLLSL